MKWKGREVEVAWCRTWKAGELGGCGGPYVLTKEDNGLCPACNFKVAAKILNKAAM